MKNKAVIITLIVVFSIFVLSLLGFMIAVLSGKFTFNSSMFLHRTSNVLVMDKVYHEQFRKIDVRSDASEILIKKSSDSSFRVVVYGDKERTVVDDNNGSLLVNSKGKKCIGFCFENTISKIEVYVPSSFAGTMDIRNQYGDIQVEEFLNADITIEENCGDVLVFGGNRVKVNNDYGDITVQKADTLEVEEDCGDVIIGTVASLKVENHYGDIRIEKVTGFLDVSDNCGDIEIDSISLVKDSVIHNDYGDIEVGSTNEIFIDAKVDLGDIKVNKNHRESKITLKIENDLGDILVNN